LLISSHLTRSPIHQSSSSFIIDSPPFLYSFLITLHLQSMKKSPQEGHERGRAPHVYGAGFLGED